MTNVRKVSAPHSQRVGVLVSAPLESDLVTQIDLVQCCHCQFTTVYTPGLERRWGVCWKCNDWHCDKHSCCVKCVPVRRWLDNMHEGKPADHVPIVATVPGVIGEADNGGDNE